MMRKWIALLAAVLLISAGAYFGSPYWTARTLKAAAISADKDRLEDVVDFPAVRESLKSQLSTALARKMNDDPNLKGNPFAGLGLLIVPTLVDRLVDTYVTADGIAALAKGGKPNGHASTPENPDLRYDYHWVSTDRFRVTLVDTNSSDQGPSFLLERRGFVRWKLIKIELPEMLLSGSG